jgi:hypothetical protein
VGPLGGSSTVKTKFFSETDALRPFIEGTWFRAGEWCMVGITANGPGRSPEAVSVQKKSKPEYRGTVGLSLKLRPPLLLQRTADRLTRRLDVGID